MVLRAEGVSINHGDYWHRTAAKTERISCKMSFTDKNYKKTEKYDKNVTTCITAANYI